MDFEDRVLVKQFTEALNSALQAKYVELPISSEGVTSFRVGARAFLGPLQAQLHESELESEIELKLKKIVGQPLEAPEDGNLEGNREVVLKFFLKVSRDFIIIGDKIISFMSCLPNETPNEVEPASYEPALVRRLLESMVSYLDTVTTTETDVGCRVMVWQTLCVIEERILSEEFVGVTIRQPYFKDRVRRVSFVTLVEDQKNSMGFEILAMAATLIDICYRVIEIVRDELNKVADGDSQLDDLFGEESRLTDLS